ncbi:hypothetical protein [Parvibacter caecicola]|uniref:HEAT repeat domain-containing protein n=1 Tax=Parvibacter caecicola TaxID=747645 RepID=A0A7W5D174_9ACTN|nr:hypothetical protein [Parvibacter caecicola]MBB3170979.1 hypothetical protein [Parvibacter caecicola]MCR2042226.1 hypothetical protein [Parvibacter caecicola]RNL09108.1 hypothetical protein DMP11_09550 [Parvibacter caecicola]
MAKPEAILNKADEAMESPELVEELVEALSGASRRERQKAASVLAVVAKKKPELLQPATEQFVEALNVPEAQTRWEVLDVLTELVSLEARVCEKAVPEADAALFDEDSGPARLAAMRFLCRLGATTEKRSEKVWPLIDEGIQCYHGDLEFQDMLTAVVGFSEGKLAPEVKAALKERMGFDATNSKGALQRKAASIVQNVS